MKKGFLASLASMETDVLCLQETKAQDEQVMEALKELEGFHIYCNSAEKKGYSGTAILTKQEPISVEYDMDIEEHDQEGRVITAEFESFYLVTVYTPNSGSELKRLAYRQEWDKDFNDYLGKSPQGGKSFGAGNIEVDPKDKKPKAKEVFELVKSKMENETFFKKYQTELAKV